MEHSKIFRVEPIVTLIFYKFLAAFLILLVSILSVIHPLRKKKPHLEHTESMELGEAFASGIFLGAAFFHMLPDSIKVFSELYGPNNFPFPEAICVFGFLLLLFLERLSAVSAYIRSENSILYILILILTIHSLTEGAALGIGGTFSEAVMLFIAIMAHKGSESFALCVTLQRHKIPLGKIILIVAVFSLMTPIGIALGAAVNFFAYVRNDRLVECLFNAFAAGTFLYMSTLHHIHFHRHSNGKQGLYEFGSLFVGICMMGIIAIWA